MEGTNRCPCCGWRSKFKTAKFCLTCLRRATEVAKEIAKRREESIAHS